MTDRPKLYPGHRHMWADYNPHRVGLYTSLVRCTVCGFEAPRNAAGLDGRMPAHDGPRCSACDGPLVWQRTPLLPAPAGIWQHQIDPADDHHVAVPWANQPEQETRTDD